MFRSKQKILSYFGAIALAWTSGAPGGGLNLSFETIAVSGEQAPGAPDGVAFSALLRAPMLNDQGEVTFIANITLGNGLWGGTPGNLSLLALSGQPAPGTDALFTGVGNEHVINEAGAVLFDASLNDGRRGLWLASVHDPGPLVPVAVEGELIPGAEPAQVCGYIFDQALNDSGEVMFTEGGQLGPGTLWVGPPGGLVRVIGAGDPLPGFPTYTVVGPGGYPRLLNDGRVVLGLQGGPQVFCRGFKDALEVVAAQTCFDPVAGPCSWVDTYFVAANGAGDVLYEFLYLTPPPSFFYNLAAIAFNSGGAAILGFEPPPDPTGPPNGCIDYPLISDSGIVAGIGNQPHCSGDPVIWYGHWSALLQVIARPGDAVPDISDATFGGFTSYHLNAQGRLSLCATLSPAGGEAIFMTDESGQLHAVVGPGDEIEVRPGDFRTVAFAEILSQYSAGSDGWPSPLNSNGDLGFVAVLTDGSYALMVAREVAPCPWDLDGNGAVGILDFLAVLAAWGSNPPGPADFDGDGMVGITDFLELLAYWGACP